MIRLVVATNNPGKQREYQQLLAPLGLLLLTPQDLARAPTVLESGTTYAENAQLKAQAYQQSSGLLTLADDSGLEVDALDGAPGLHSARYAGPAAGDVDRYRLLLTELEGVPREQRTARFRCVVVLAAPKGETHTTEALCEGLIAFEPRGDSGFGYDPVFYMPEHNATMAQLPMDLKNRISHRARALHKMLPILRRILSQGNVSADH
jgi:XTP/dITP diphosphohydrolase